MTETPERRILFQSSIAWWAGLFAAVPTPDSHAKAKITRPSCAGIICFLPSALKPFLKLLCSFAGLRRIRGVSIRHYSPTLEAMAVSRPIPHWPLRPAFQSVRSAMRSVRPGCGVGSHGPTSGSAAVRPPTCIRSLSLRLM